MQAIAHSYWRLIKVGRRTFESVKDSVKDDVKTLARGDVENGVITALEYEDFIGEPYQGGE